MPVPAGEPHECSSSILCGEESASLLSIAGKHIGRHVSAGSAVGIISSAVDRFLGAQEVASCLGGAPAPNHSVTASVLKIVGVPIQPLLVVFGVK